MPQMLQSMGTFMSGAGGKGLNNLLGLAGAGGNIFSSVQNFQQQQKQIAAQDYVRSLLKDPAKYNKAVAGYTAPLDAGLTAGITNQVQGQLAERGLGSSPASFASAETQALAPYVQQNKQNAINNLFQMLGMSTQGTAPTPMTDISKLLSQLKIGGSGSGGNPYQTLYDAQQPDQSLFPTDTTPADNSPAWNLGAAA